MRKPRNDPIELIEFGEKFKDLLDYHGVSQSGLARQVDGLTRHIVNLMIAGNRLRLTPRNFLRCLNGLVTLEKLTDEDVVRDWLEELYIARGIKYGDRDYKPLEVRPEGREILELIKQIPERRQKALEEVPSRIWNVPYLRNLYFTGREEILTRLHNKFSLRKTLALTQPHAISGLGDAITGLGGIGKTQIAMEYAYRYGREYNAVLWVNADSQESLFSEFAKLASLLNLSETKQKDQTEVVAAVKRWLQEKTDWLLIFDNADDIKVALEFLPTGASGHMLLTTRSQPTGDNIIGIEVEKMGREEGVLFVLRRAKIIAEDAPIESASDAQRNDAETLYKLLDGLPLALDQAASYIDELGRSLQEYLVLYKNRYKILWKRRGRFSEKDYSKTVATTWSLYFESVEQNNPTAAELLRLCAFLHPDAIPQELIINGAAELGSILQDMASDQIRLDEAIGELFKYSLVQRNAETLTIHRLVQAVLKERMDE